MTRALRTTGSTVPAASSTERSKRRGRAVPVVDLSDREMALIRQAGVETDAPYTLDDLPDDPAA